MSRGGPNYTTVEAVREEGVDPTLTDKFIWRRIQTASREIDRWTGRWFYPRSGSYDLDSEGQPVLSVPDPIVSIESVATICGDGTTDPIDPECYVVYNRHLTLGMTSAGDQDAPRIEFRTDRLLNRYPVSGYSSSLVPYIGRRRTFPSANQAMRVVGRFGYTEPTQACVVSVAELFVLADGDSIDVSIDGAAAATVLFTTGDFADITNATAEEVVGIVQAASVAGLAAEVVYVDAGPAVRLSSTTVSASSSIQVLETTAAPGSVFGFPTGVVSNPEGVTPEGIQLATLLLTILNLVEYGDVDSRWRTRNRGRLTEMKTRDQSIKFGTSSSSGELIHQSIGMWTGDPEIDNIISYYYRPPEMTFVGGVDHDLAERPEAPPGYTGYGWAHAPWR